MSGELPDLIVTPVNRGVKHITSKKDDPTQTQPNVQNPALEPQKNEQPKSRVIFDMTQNVVHEIWHYKDLSPLEAATTWVTVDDMIAGKRENCAIITKMMKAKGEHLEETDDFTVRGFEFKTREGARQRKKNKRRAYTAVLQEQEIQREEDVNEPELIAEVYREVAAPLALEALNRGWKDQKVMLDLLDPEIRLERERRLSASSPKTKSKTVIPPIMAHPRRRSMTETLNANEMQAYRGAV